MDYYYWLSLIILIAIDDWFSLVDFAGLLLYTSRRQNNTHTIQVTPSNSNIHDQWGSKLIETTSAKFNGSDKTLFTSLQVNSIICWKLFKLWGFCCHQTSKLDTRRLSREIKTITNPYQLAFYNISGIYICLREWLVIHVTKLIAL